MTSSLGLEAVRPSLKSGPGHGMLGYFVLREGDNIRYVGVDISEPALRYADRAFDRAGFSPSKVTFVVGDATDLAASGVPDADGLVCREVLEHVDDPASILRGIGGHLNSGGRALLSTVANLEAIDHVYLYDNVDEIRSMVSEARLRVLNDWPMRLPGDTSERLIPYNYAGIVGHAG